MCLLFTCLFVYLPVHACIPTCAHACMHAYILYNIYIFTFLHRARPRDRFSPGPTPRQAAALPAKVLQEIQEAKFQQPTPIQVALIVEFPFGDSFEVARSGTRILCGIDVFKRFQVRRRREGRGFGALQLMAFCSACRLSRGLRKTVDSDSRIH